MIISMEYIIAVWIYFCVTYGFHLLLMSIITDVSQFFIKLFGFSCVSLFDDLIPLCVFVFFLSFRFLKSAIVCNFSESDSIPKNYVIATCGFRIFCEFRTNHYIIIANKIQPEKYKLQEQEPASDCSRQPCWTFFLFFYFFLSESSVD